MRKDLPTIIKQAVKVFNLIGVEYISEEIETNINDGKPHYWSVEDIKKEAQYWISTYCENGHINCDFREDDSKLWNKHTKALKDLIADCEEYYKL